MKFPALVIAICFNPGIAIPVDAGGSVRDPALSARK
jgi:hypothetical protein